MTRSVNDEQCAYDDSSDYNFGLPSFPWINGRDFAGIVVKVGKGVSRVKLGDAVSFGFWRQD